MQKPWHGTCQSKLLLQIPCMPHQFQCTGQVVQWFSKTQMTNSNWMAESSVNSEKNVISTIVNITLDFIIIFPTSIFYSSLWEREMTWAKTIHVCNRVWDNFRGTKCKLIYSVGSRMLNAGRLSVNELLIIIATRWEAASFKLSYSAVESIYWLHSRKKYSHRFCVQILEAGLSLLFKVNNCIIIIFMLHQRVR